MLKRFACPFKKAGIYETRKKGAVVDGYYFIDLTLNNPEFGLPASFSQDGRIKSIQLQDSHLFIYTPYPSPYR
jgi:hypothetical protein